MNETKYLHKDEMLGSFRASESIVPLILAITGPIKSVVDIGGGDGSWLKVFKNSKVDDILLMDCQEVESELVIDKKYYQAVDLNSQLPEPRRFDLALCLECAEHLSSLRAKSLVEWLSASSDIVVFSAAIPGQGGKGHINERRCSYWQNLFSQQGFKRHDILRNKIIHDEAIPFWYRQNLFVFAKPTAVLKNCQEANFLPDEFELVHVSNAVQNGGFKAVFKQLGPSFVSVLSRRLKR